MTTIDKTPIFIGTLNSKSHSCRFKARRHRFCLVHHNAIYQHRHRIGLMHGVRSRFPAFAINRLHQPFPLDRHRLAHDKHDEADEQDQYHGSISPFRGKPSQQDCYRERNRQQLQHSHLDIPFHAAIRQPNALPRSEFQNCWPSPFSLPRRNVHRSTNLRATCFCAVVILIPEVLTYHKTGHSNAVKYLNRLSNSNVSSNDIFYLSGFRPFPSVFFVLFHMERITPPP